MSGRFAAQGAGFAAARDGVAWALIVFRPAVRVLGAATDGGLTVQARVSVLALADYGGVRGYPDLPQPPANAG